MKIHNIRWLRRLGLPLLKRFANRDANVKHHHTGTPFNLNLYHHKGYWFHGNKREAVTLALCREIIQPQDVVFDVGGHIGYLTVFFASLAPAGTVHVFEPGPNNLGYLRRNIAPLRNVVLNPKAVGRTGGTAKLTLDPMSGQNNSLVTEYTIFQENMNYAVESSAASAVVEVEVIRLDDYVSQIGRAPDFVKIDVEGFELQALEGMTQTMDSAKPTIMVEISNDHRSVCRLLESRGYRLHYADLQPVNPEDMPKIVNVFAFHRDRQTGLPRGLSKTAA